MADAFTRPRPAPRMPLSAHLAAKLPKPAREHSKLLERFDAVRAREAELGRQIEAARRTDAEAARRAVADGAAIPERTELELLGQLDDLARERDAVRDVAEQSAARLLVAGAKVAPGLVTALEAEAAEVEARAFEQLEAALGQFDQAAALRGELMWCAELGASSHPEGMRGYRGTSANSDPARMLRTTIAQIRAERERAERERSRPRYGQRAEPERAQAS